MLEGMDDFTRHTLRRDARLSRDAAAQALRALAVSLDRAADEVLAGTLTRSAADLMAECMAMVKAVGRFQADEAATAEPWDAG
jgi:hypothetical protein